MMGLTVSLFGLVYFHMASVRSYKIYFILLVAGLCGGVWFYQDSIIRHPSPVGNIIDSTGVVFYDRLRAFPGYTIISKTGGGPTRHIIIDMDGKTVAELPGRLPAYIPDGGYAADENSLVLYNELMEQSWKKPLEQIHHEISYDHEAKEIFVLNEIQKTAEDGRPIKIDEIRGFDLDGNSIFAWNAEESQHQLAKMFGLKSEPFWDEEAGSYTYTHITGVVSLANNLKKSAHPAFAAGNLLISESVSSTLVIFDRKTMLPLWTYKVYPGEAMQVHSPRLLDNGNILFFKNNSPPLANPKASSEVVELDPIKKQVVWGYSTLGTERFSSKRFGWVERLGNGNTLITYTSHKHGGGVFEVGEYGRVVWEWVNPEPSSSGEVYRAIRLEKRNLDPILEKSGQKH